MSTTRLRLLVAPCAALLLLAGCSSSGSGDDPAPAAPSYDDSGVTARVLPQLAATGDDLAPADEAEWVVEATVEGARPGTEVELHALEGDEWVVTDTRETDGKGRVSLTSPSAGDLHVVTREEAPIGAEVSTDEAPAVSFQDDFDEDSVHGDRTWQTRAQGHVGVRQCSEAVDEAAEVVDGVMRLYVMDDPERGTCNKIKSKPDYLVNGHVGTESTYNFTYGYAAARIRFQPERGQHGAFWLQAAGGQAPRGPEKGGAEIDVIEYFGDGHPDGGLTSFTYWLDEKGEIRTKGGWISDPDRYGGDWADTFHVFSVEWTPDEYVFRIDGQVTHRLNGPTSGVPQFLILSLLSSDYEIKHFNGELPVHMDVDWVRAWETGA